MSASSANVSGTVRGIIILNHLSAIDCLSEAERKQVLSAIGPIALQWARQVQRLEWVSIDSWMQIGEPMRMALGDREYAATWRRLMVDLVGQPIFKNLVTGAVAMFGLQPSSFIKIVPAASSAVFKDIGKFTVQESERGSASVEWTSVPENVLAHRAMLIGFLGAFSGFFELCGNNTPIARDGRVEHSTLTAGVTFRFTWPVH